MLLLQTLLARCLKKTTCHFPEPHAFIRKQNLFVFFAVVKFVYVLSEPYRLKRLSIAILALALAPAAPELGEPD